MQRIVALVGPTAVGKTAIAVELALALDAEIVSCDSMQVYRQVPLLSQAPTRAQRALVQHHLLDCIEPTENFSAGQYHQMALPVIEYLLSRGKRVLLVGGTGLYLKAITEGLCDAPAGDVRVREQLWHECRQTGSPSLHNRLQGIDATAASRIHPNDARRIIRALEVYALTGKPLSSWWRQARSELFEGPVTVIGLTREREELYQRINARLLHMLYEEGVINEVRQVLKRPLSRTARQIHGLADIEQYLHGVKSLKEITETWQQRVRHYAKRQMTWFRQTPGVQWVELKPDEHPWESAARILPLVRSNTSEPAPLLSEPPAVGR
jgi:tRNA dimethylallyltransferase